MPPKSLPSKATPPKPLPPKTLPPKPLPPKTLPPRTLTAKNQQPKTSQTTTATSTLLKTTQGHSIPVTYNKELERENQALWEKVKVLEALNIRLQEEILDKFATVGYHYYILFFAGLGMSFTYIPNAVSLVYAYKDQYMLPLSVGSMGAGMGMMILPLLTQKLLEAYNWRGTVLVIGALYLHIVVCGTCLDPTTLNSGKTSPPTSHDSSTKPSSIKSPVDDDDSNSMLFRCSHKASGLIRTACREAGLHVFSEYPLIIYAFIAACLHGISYSGWTVFVISNAESKGAAEAVAVLLSLVSGIANTAGRLMPGLFNFLNKDVFSSTILFILFGIIGALPLCMNRISTHFSTLCGFAAISGFALGAKSVLKNTNALDVVPRYLSSTALPFTFISAGLGEIAGGWITGLIFDVTGSMDMAFLFLGCVDIFCVIVLTLSILHGKIISSK
nr:monocarboxylate transporter 12-like [Lytechinus pictus]